jgi:hypothetical protein
MSMVGVVFLRVPLIMVHRDAFAIFIIFREKLENASLSDRFFFLRKNYYKIAKVRYFPGEKVYIRHSGLPPPYFYRDALSCLAGPKISK